MTKTRRRLLLAGVMMIAALLAFPLRETIYETIVIPAAFIGWELGLFYRSFSQATWWWLIVIVVLFMLAFSLLPQIKPRSRDEQKPHVRRGPVEDFAVWLERSRGGVYFKWLVANRLGKLAYQFLLHRESGRARSVFAPLVGTDWQPPEDLRAYLETGLHGSFSDFPSVKGPFAAPQQTPLDYEVGDAVQFLESQMQNGRPGL
jgi:hypothetical protein